MAGNPGKRPINKAEPVPLGNLDELAPPSWMTESQRAGWCQAIAHAPKGLLRKLDAALLTVWVVAEDTHRAASIKVQLGMVVRTPTGAPMQSPYLSIMNRQAEIMMRAASELGFTPTSRSRITLGGSKGQEGSSNRFARNGKRPS